MVRQTLALIFLLSLAMSCGDDKDDDADAAAGGNAGSDSGGAPSQNVRLVRGNGRCLPRELAVDPRGRLPCSILEATPDASQCSCDLPGRLELTSETYRDEALTVLEADGLCGGTTGVDCAATCICEVQQLAAGELAMCQNQADTGDLVGFCYID